MFGNATLNNHVMPVLEIKINNEIIPVVNQAKSLGLLLDNSLRFRDQISNYVNRAYQSLRKIFPLRSCLSVNAKKILCNALVLSQFNYCVPVYHAALDSVTSDRIQKVQNSRLRYIYVIRKYEHISHKLVCIGWLNMTNRRILQTLSLYHKILQSKYPPYLYNKITFRSDVHNLSTRFRGRISPPHHRTFIFERSFSFQICRLYNNLPENCKTCPFNLFRKRIRKMLIQSQTN